MTERRRTSKWDVIAEPQDTVAQTDSPSMKADDSCSDWKSSKWETNSFPPSEVKADPVMMGNESSEPVNLTAWSYREDDSDRLPNARSPSPHFPKRLDMDADDRDYLKMEPLAAHTTGKDEEFNGRRDSWNKSVEQNYSTSRSAGHDSSRQQSPAILPKRSWSRSHRSRSRSRSRSRDQGRSRSWSRNRSRSWSRSRSRSQTRSPSYGFRQGPERNRSRSRSPPYDARRGPEKWPGRGRTGGGLTVPCRDFAAGRCQRGSECRFLHEDSGQRHSNRYYDSSAADTRESRGERGRYSGQGRDNFRDSKEAGDYQRDRFSRNDRATTKCYDFTKGRCHRGSECRYAHHEASYDSRWDARDEGRARSHDQRGADPSYGRRLDPPRRAVGHTPCKFFAEGRCRRGEACTFSHQAAGPRDDKTGYIMRTVSSNSSWNGRNQGDEAVVINMSDSSQWMGNDNDSKVDDSSFKSQNSQSQVLESNAHQNQPQEASNLLPLPSVPGQSFGPGSQSQYTYSHPIQAQNFTPNVQIQPLVPPMPLNAQVQQAIFPLPQIGQGQFVAPQAPSNFNPALQILPVLPSQIGLNQQSYNMPPHGGQDQQNFNLRGQIQQNFPVPPFNGHNLLNSNFIGQSHQTLPPVQDGHGQNVASQPPHPEAFNPNEKLMQRADMSETQPSQINSDTPIIQKVVTSEQAAQITNLSVSLAQFFGSAGALNPQIATGLVPIVRPHQGSLTQQHANPTSGNMEPVNLDTNNLPPGFEPKDAVIKEAQTNITSSVPLPVIVGTNYGIPPATIVDLEVKTMQGIENTAATDVNDTETVHNKKEQAEDLEASLHADEESNQSKDGKGMRMFKSALVEFVKDVLKPTWKEGHLSKEAHKTIVKKVVDKVTGAMQSQTIPQTQEKIDIYMMHSKVKLTKLVQAYVDKYVKA